MSKADEVNVRTPALQPRSAALHAIAHAKRLFLAADFKQCLATLDEVGDSNRARSDDATLLRARVHVLQGSNSETLAILDRRRRAWMNDRARVEASVLIATARVREAREDTDLTSVWKLIEETTDLVFRLADVELKAEIAYVRAMWFWTRSDCERAEEELSKTPEQSSARARCRALIMQAHVEARRERYHRQVYFLRKALRVLDGAAVDQQDVWLRANVVCFLALLARDLPLPDVAEVVASELRTLPWTDDLRLLRFQTVRALAWWVLLQGRNDEAFVHLAEAEELAPSKAWRVMAILQRAHLSRTIGERYWWKVDLALAQRYAEDVDWSIDHGEEKNALLLFAELCADQDPVRANDYAKVFAGVRHNTRPTHFANADRRVRAFECYAAGVTQKALQDCTGAEMLLREAFGIFRALGYDWRAALAAKALAELTHDGSWLVFARDLVREYPLSWIAVDLGPDRERVDPDLRRLKPSQRRVFFAACEGLASREIGRQLKRSHHTIDTHLRAIYRVFGVHSRGELQAEARRRGIVRSAHVRDAAAQDVRSQATYA